jgi:type II secretory pathway pseudopilin PulG
MAALLVAMTVMAILMSVALPTWTRMVQREREEELIFRGEQYARALRLLQTAKPGATPNTLDQLIDEHYLRKKYKDPLSPEKDGEFQLLRVGTPSAGTAGSGGAAGQQPGTAGSVLSTSGSGGIMGVVSKNTAESIRTYNGKNHYNEWQFIGMQQSTQGGSGAQGSTRGGPQRGSGTVPGGSMGTSRGTGTGPGTQGRGTPPPNGQPPPRNANLPPRLQ